MGFFTVDNKVVDEVKFDNSVEGFLFVVIARYSNNSRYSFPSIDLLSEKCRCARGSVIKAIKSLERKGFIAVERVAGRSNRYTVESSLIGRPSSVTGEQGSTSRELYKEQYINNNRKIAPPYLKEFSREEVYYEPID